ncbi:MAG TPA: hypothetical protein VNX86_13635 [Rhizomicrobium sp.]|jgi:predicted nucleic acid-binding protein|nr:hypothetical protein [Rhizomicrobium sp.]
MPILTIEQEEINIPRNLALLDTNVLVARFDQRDRLHPEARLILDEDNRFWWLVISPVVVEAAGMLMKRQGEKSVLSMLRWLITPGTRTFLLTCLEGPRELEKQIPGLADLIAKRRIDYVDAHLMRAASILTDICALAPHSTPIVTGDGRDFFSGSGFGYRYSLLDLRDPGGEVIRIC